MQLFLSQSGPASLCCQANARHYPVTVNNLSVQHLFRRLSPLYKLTLPISQQERSSACFRSIRGVSMSATTETNSHQQTQTIGQQNTDNSTPDKSSKQNPSYSIHPSSGLTSFQQHEVLNAEREWQAISSFWKEAVAGRTSLQDLHPPVMSPEQYFPDMQLCKQEGSTQGQPAASDQVDASQDEKTIEQPPKRRRKQDRCTYKVLLAYYGPAFDGFAVQNGSQMVTVQGSLCDVLQPLLGQTTKAQVSGAGRTDKGVSALGQVFSFYSWTPLTPQVISNAVASVPNVPQGSIRAVAISSEQRSFHANFAATWRRYVYLLPLRKSASLQPIQRDAHHSDLDDGITAAASLHNSEPVVTTGKLKNEMANIDMPLIDIEHLGQPTTGVADGPQADVSPERLQQLRQVLRVLETEDVSPEVAHRLLQPLVGVPLDYSAYARDTPKGKDTICTLSVARASRVRLPDSCGGGDALCVELVANRFLRKMVRVLVGTLVMESLGVQSRMYASRDSQHTIYNGEPNCEVEAFQKGAGMPASVLDNDVHDCWDGMLRHCGPTASRLHTAVPAPAEGLCFAGVGYGDIQAV